MNREGHIGISVGIAGIIGVPFVLLGQWEAYVVAVFSILATSTLPDIDQKTGLVKHRGWTHTVWFAGLVGLSFGIFILAVGMFLPVISLPWAIGLAFLSCVTAAGGIGVHIGGDIATIRGIRPYQPVLPRDTLKVQVSDKKYQLGLFKAADNAANAGAVILGVIIALVLNYAAIVVVS